MHISINTAEEISDLDRQMLAVLLGQEFVLGTTQEFESEPDPEPAKPVKKTAEKKAAAKKPEPKPDPAAEEPLEEDEEPEDEEFEDEVEEDDVDDTSDEDLLALAVKKATEMVAGGEASTVRAALEAAGASRVRELNKDNVREFFKALS